MRKLSLSLALIVALMMCSCTSKKNTLAAQPLVEPKAQAKPIRYIKDTDATTYKIVVVVNKVKDNVPKSFVCEICLVFGKPRPVNEPKPEWMKAMEKKLQQPYTFNFEGTPFTDVISQIQHRTGLIFLIAPDAFDGIVEQLNSNVDPSYPMKLETVLNWITKMANVKWSLKDEAIYIERIDAPADEDITYEKFKEFQKFVLANESQLRERTILILQKYDSAELTNKTPAIIQELKTELEKTVVELTKDLKKPYQPGILRNINIPEFKFQP
jgi:hypothetical protein